VVTANIPKLAGGLIKEIEFILQRNNNPSLEIFDTVEASEIVSGTTVDTLAVSLRDSTSTILIPSTDIVQTYENIPRTSTTVELKDNRIFFAGGESGYDDDSVDLNLSLIISAATSGGNVMTLKQGGSYTIGLSFEDKYGWKSPVLIKKQVTNPIIGEVTDANRRFLQVGLFGTPPSWAVRAHVMAKEEGNYETYEEFPVYILPGVSTTTAESNASQSVASVILDGYQIIARAYWTAGIQTVVNFVILKMPVNLPFIVTAGMKLRFKEEY
jgi:hypothetical protein